MAPGLRWQLTEWRIQDGRHNIRNKQATGSMISWRAGKGEKQ